MLGTGQLPTICRYRCERILKASDTSAAILVRSTTDSHLYVLKRAASPNHNQIIQEEAVLLARAASHPHILKFVETFIDEMGRAVLVTEWCEGGDLSTWISATEPSVRVHHAADLFRQLASGLAHLHSLNIIHRDLKPRNILVLPQPKGVAGGLQIRVKIGDFGVSKAATLAETALGTPLYLCPEIVQGRSYSFPSDVWSLGCVMYEVCSGKPPFPGRTLRELLLAITKSDPEPLRTDSVVAKHVHQCLAKEPRERPTAAELLDRASGFRKPLDREQCVQLLRQRFGEETANGILSCLSTTEPKESAFERAKQVEIRLPAGQRMLLQRIVKLRQELASILDEEPLERASNGFKQNCTEQEMIRNVGDKLHKILSESDLYAKVRELSVLEDSLLTGSPI